MTARPTEVDPRCSFEVLESRRLLAVVSVASFGALPNDGADDSYAIQRAINSSAPGDTISFGAGTYNVSRTLDPRGDGRTIQGMGQQSTTLVAGNDFVFHFQGKNLTITGITMQGRGIFFDTPNGSMVENVTVDNCRFNVLASGEKSNGIEFTTGLRNTKITNNWFENLADNGIYGYYWDNLYIANNSFIGGGEGIHVAEWGNSSHNLLIEQNYFSDLRRMGIEYQGGGVDTIVQDNYYDHPRLTSNFHDNDSTFAYSVIADQAINMIVRRNTVVSLERPDGVGVRYAFEFGGNFSVLEDNYVLGSNHVVGCTGGSNGIVRNNLFIDYLQAPSAAGWAPGFQFINNGPDVHLTWDINRGIPGPNRRLSDTPLPPWPGNTGTGGGIVLDAPTELGAEAVAANRIVLTWKDNARGEVGYKIERSLDGKTWTQIAVVGPNATRFTNVNVPVGKKISYRLRAYGRGGNSDYSNVAEVTTEAPKAEPPPVLPGGSLTGPVTVGSLNSNGELSPFASTRIII